MSASPTTSDCFICGQPLPLGDNLMLGELVDCGACGTEFEISAIDPLAMIEAPSVGEDWGQ